MFDEKLGKALNFTEEDLIANRDGYMTKPQRVKLRKSFSWWQAGLWLLGMSFPCIMQLILFTYRSMERNPTVPFLDLPDMNLNALAAITFLVIWGLLAYFGGRNARTDLRKGEVAIIEGVVTVNPTRFIARPQLHLDNGWWFIIPHKAIKVFVENHRYTIYYAPHTMQILSAEPMVEP